MVFFAVVGVAAEVASAVASVFFAASDFLGFLAVGVDPSSLAFLFVRFFGAAAGGVADGGGGAGEEDALGASGAELMARWKQRPDCLAQNKLFESMAFCRPHIYSVCSTSREHIPMLSLLNSSCSSGLVRVARPSESKALLWSQQSRKNVTKRTRAAFSPLLTHRVRAYASQYIEPVNKSKRSVTAENRAVLTLPKGVERTTNVSEEARKNWSDCGLANEAVLQAVAELGFKAPTLIQQLVIPEIAKKGTENLVFADQTGTGKTLAYLLPIVQSLKEEELKNGRSDMPSRPRAIVLVPNRELAEQVLKICKKLCHVVKLRAASFSGGATVSKQRQHFEAPIDILVATPGRLLQHYDRKRIFFSKLKHVVFDEVDMLLDATDGGFAQDCYRVVDAVRHRTEATQAYAQFVLCGATITQVLLREIENTFPNATNILSPTLHKSVSKLNQTWITVAADRLSKLKEILFADYHRKSGAFAEPLPRGSAKFKREEQESKNLDSEAHPLPKSMKRTIIFCNTINSCRFLDLELQELGFKVTSYHGDIPVDQRPLNFAKFANGEIPIMVCTDIASRGLDFTAVDHVILFDFPLNSVDYLHRIGRTARAGKAGKVTNFVMKRDLVLADAIRDALKKGLPLDGLSSSASENATRERYGSL